MASVDCICTDYTGILTSSEMVVNSIFVGDKNIDNKDVKNLRELISADLFEFFCESISINTMAFAAEKQNKYEYYGDPVECSMIKFLKFIEVDYSMLRNNILRPIIDCSPYSPDNKLSFTIIEMDEKRDYVRLYVKSSPDNILDLISIYIERDQSLQPLAPWHYEKIKQRSLNIMREGCIPVIICYRDILRDTYNQTRHAYINKDTDFAKNICRQLTFICMVGLKDEVKPDVEENIKMCQDTGVEVKMVTSQDKESARVSAEKMRNCREDVYPFRGRKEYVEL